MVVVSRHEIEEQYAAPITFEEWIAMPVDGERTELLNGELIVSPLSFRRHQQIQSALGHQLLNASEKLANAEVYFGTNLRSSGVDGLIPDLAVFTGSAGGELTDYGVSGPIDLVVEILSPSNRSYDLVAKAAEYAKLGVPEYWIVDPVKPALIVGKLLNGEYIRSIYSEGTVRCDALGGAEINLGFLQTE
ncbi:Uma2 family endonuclease [soil metagenome]